jgi:hypothetical protein
MPPGFDKQNLPGTQEKEEEKPGKEDFRNKNNRANEYGDEFDPTATEIVLHDGSLASQLAWGMNEAVNRLRERQGRSLEDIMLAMVAGGPEGPNTSVEGLMYAALEASRVFLLEK